MARFLSATEENSASGPRRAWKPGAGLSTVLPVPLAVHWGWRWGSVYATRRVPFSSSRATAHSATMPSISTLPCATTCRLSLIVGNDALWNAEHQLQIRNYGPDRTVGCELLPSRYDKVVEALGGHGEFVQEVHELAPAVERSLASDLPACINVAINAVAAPTFH